MKKWLLAGMAAAALMSAGSAALAAPFLTLNPAAADGSINGVFGNDGAPAAGTFTDTFTFTWPSAGDTVGSISTSATKLKGKINPATNIDFLSVTLDGQAFTLSPTGQFEFGALDLPTLKGTQTLVVNYKSYGKGATYSGTLAFTPAAVPEPASWALMIGGFGLLGATLRMRRNSVFA
jgi:PEP-CTERM motif